MWEKAEEMHMNRIAPLPLYVARKRNHRSTAWRSFMMGMEAPTKMTAPTLNVRKQSVSECPNEGTKRRGGLCGVHNVTTDNPMERIEVESNYVKDDNRYYAEADHDTDYVHDELQGDAFQEVICPGIKGWLALVVVVDGLMFCRTGHPWINK